jgi:hypothetical protein
MVVADRDLVWLIRGARFFCIEEMKYNKHCVSLFMRVGGLTLPVWVGHEKTHRQIKKNKIDIGVGLFR